MQHYVVFPFIHSNSTIVFLYFLWDFDLQVKTDCICPNSKPKVHIGLDLLFANVPKNLRVPAISSSSSDVPQWNKRSSTYVEVLFAFANANLHDDGVLVFAHATHPDVSRSIHKWAHTEDFYVAEDWFGTNDLNLQSPTNPSELVISFLPHSFVNLSFFPCIFVFLILPLSFLADSQILHQGARA